MPITIQDLKAKRTEIVQTGLRYHAQNIRIFGSVARGEANDDSDIDVLVSFLPEASLFDQIGLIEELSLMLHRKVDVISCWNPCDHIPARSYPLFRARDLLNELRTRSEARKA